MAVGSLSNNFPALSIHRRKQYIYLQPSCNPVRRTKTLLSQQICQECLSRSLYFKGGEGHRVISSHERRVHWKGKGIFPIMEVKQHSISAPENQLVGVIC